MLSYWLYDLLNYMVSSIFQLFHISGQVFGDGESWAFSVLFLLQEGHRQILESWADEDGFHLLCSWADICHDYHPFFFYSFIKNLPFTQHPFLQPTRALTDVFL